MGRLVPLALALAAALTLVACAGAPAGTLAEQAPPAPAATVGALTISAPWVRAAQHHGSTSLVTSAAYMTIANSGAEADALIGAAAPDLAEAVELHVASDEGGIMKMGPVERIELPAHGEVTLEPGGFHIMLVGVRRELKAGDSVTLNLTFARAGAVEVAAVVRAAGQ